MLLRALQRTAFWPVIASRSCTSCFWTSFSWMPNAMLMTIFVRRGTNIGFVTPSFFSSAGTISLA